MKTEATIGYEFLDQSQQQIRELNENQEADQSVVSYSEISRTENDYSAIEGEA